MRGLSQVSLNRYIERLKLLSERLQHTVEPVLPGSEHLQDLPLSSNYLG